MPDPVLSIENISKRYKLDSAEGDYGLLVHQINRWLRRKGSVAPNEGLSELWALSDLSFVVDKPSVIGIIGGNGSGKSTLLKILGRITSPTSGRAVLNGRVSALIELNVGFHAELSGRDNVYLMGTTLGLSRQEVSQSFDQIVEFSEVAKFINTPVKYYSSGMFLRLGFAVAAHLRPEILLIDEVLAVGDAAFQNKCIDRIKEIAKEGATILFVSHQLDLVRQLCDQCLVLNSGRMSFFGDVEPAISRHLHNVGLADDEDSVEIARDTDLPVQISQVRSSSVKGQTSRDFEFNEPIAFTVNYIVNKSTSGLCLELNLNHSGATFFRSWDSDRHPENLSSRQPGEYTRHVTLPAKFLKPGTYTAGFAVINADNGSVVQSLPHLLSFNVKVLNTELLKASYFQPGGDVALPLEWLQEL
jgi:lipopolysaccharide transport system ATP-binding protein